MKMYLTLLMAFLCLKSIANPDTTKTSTWRYWDSVNEMTNTKSYFAKTFSDPAYGDVTISILVRYSKENEVILSIQNAIFDSQSGGININVKFDDGSIEKYGCSDAKSTMFETVFVYRDKKFIEKLKKSHKLFIEVPIYDHGKDVFKFDTSNFVWEH